MDGKPTIGPRHGQKFFRGTWVAKDVMREIQRKEERARMEKIRQERNRLRRAAHAIELERHRARRAERREFMQPDASYSFWSW